MRNFLSILFFSILCLHGLSQDSVNSLPENRDSVKPGRKDTLAEDSTQSVGRPLEPSTIDSSLSSRGARDSIIDSSTLRNRVQMQKPDTIVPSDSLKRRIKAIVNPGMNGVDRNFVNRDLVFYILVFLIFFLGLIRTSFPKYFNSIFSLSFQATFRQSQTREHMSMNIIPSFMLNLLFVLSAGLFITLIAQYNSWTSIPFWQLFIYSATILGIVYLGKYLVIRFTGWVFNAGEAAAEYRFIAFLINKLIGIFFIPLLFFIAYADGETKKISITIALCLAVFLLVLRYLVSMVRIRKNLSITAFHFFIYLCAVEIMPLLVIYKILFLRTGNS